MIDQQQFNQLYRYCYALTLQRDNAYDLLQGALEKLLRYPARQPAQEMAYLRSIIRNQFIDDQRRAKRLVFESYDALPDAADHGVIALDTQALDTVLINEEQVERILQYLDTLEREIVYLWAVEGYTAAEIATELDMPRGTVLSRIHRLRKKVLAAEQDVACDTGRVS